MTNGSEVPSRQYDNGQSTVTRDEFLVNWGPWAHISWRNLGKMAVDNPDFPLRPVEDLTVMEGDLDEALAWLQDRYGDLHRPGFVGALERVGLGRSEIPGLEK